MLKEFHGHPFRLLYFNEAEFTKFDVQALRKKEKLDDSIKFYSIKQLERFSGIDIALLTRESFFKLGKLLKNLNPNCKVVGELHGPLPLLSGNISDSLPFIDCVRVATPSVQREFKERFGYENVFVQRVSLHHLYEIVTKGCKPTNNLFIHSRFDEKTKDIAYAIKLVAYIVRELKFHDIRLYINGYGAGESLYEKLADSYCVKEYVFINTDVPEDYIYLCTSKYETFGYSIAEAICAGHRALLYHGDDRVLEENFSNLKTVCWLTKDVMKDGEKVIEFLKSVPNKEEHEIDQKLLKETNTEFAKDFLDNVSQYENPIQDVYISKKEIRHILGKESRISKYYSSAKKIYHISRKIPIVGNVLGGRTFRKYAFTTIDMVKRNVSRPAHTNLKENAFFIESFHGKNFSGDPKYLALSIKRINPDVEVYVSSASDLVDMEIRAYGFVPVRFGSAEYVKKFHQCKYIIVNGNLIDRLKKREGQVFIQTWHGFPLKRMVNDLANNSQRKRETEAFVSKMMKWDYLLTSSRFNTELLESAFLLSENPNLIILEEGLPKNEFLIKNKDNEELREALHLKYFHKRFPEGRKYVLFCPTWRREKRKSVTTIDLVKLVSLLPKEYELIVKLHPNEGHLVGEYSNLHERIHCFYNDLVDIQELYLLSDVLISDYSSSIFDFAHLGRKIIVMQEDADEYGENVGWYFNIEDVCGLKARAWTVEGLASEIIAELQGDYHKCITSKLLTNDRVGSTKKVMEQVFSFKDTKEEVV